MTTAATGDGTAFDYDAIVVGAGFAGLQLLHTLRGRGLRVVVLEAGDGVGGTWYWNRYPGARCDVESIDYSCFWADEAQQEWEWTERYAAQPELLRYLNFIAERYDLLRDIRFGVRVASAVFRPESGSWLLTTTDGEELTCHYAVMASGQLSSVKKPDFEGLDDFQGEWHHSARWPHEGVDFTGKRVAVIGTGSTGVQIIPIVAEEAAHLTVLQRTPNYVVPAQNRPLHPGELDEVKKTYVERRARARVSTSGVPLDRQIEPGAGRSEEERTAWFERGWQIGGAPDILRAYSDLMTSKETNDALAEFVRMKIRTLVDDPETAEKLTPRDYPIGSKRLCLDKNENYYITYNRPNVDLVDVKADPIVRITPTGIQLADRHLDVDIIVFAIGFDAITGAVRQIDVRGRDGESLSEHWAEGPKAYLGMQVAGFPNLFLITGPGSPAVLGNVVSFIDQHVELVGRLLDRIEETGSTTIETTPEAEEEWAAHVDSIVSNSLFPVADSWFVGANIPGKPRRFMPYAGGLVAFRTECDEALADGYRGFVLS